MARAAAVAELRQAHVSGCGKTRPVEPVGQERERRRVGRDAAEEQVGERDVGDAAAGELGDVGVDLLLRVAEREAALDGVDHRRRARREGGVERGRVVGHTSRPAAPWRRGPRRGRSAREPSRCSPAWAASRRAGRGPSRPAASRAPRARRRRRRRA